MRLEADLPLQFRLGERKLNSIKALDVDMEIIQSMVGHADIEMTQHYLHVQENVRRAAAEKFSKAFDMPR